MHDLSNFCIFMPVFAGYHHINHVMARETMKALNGDL
jgi:hypothetical protein